MAKKNTTGKVVAEISAGIIAAAAAAAAGYYFYGSPQAKKHRKIAAKWATDMKKEVMWEAKKLKDISAKDFAKVVDTVARTYVAAQSVNAPDVKRAAAELKSNWETVLKEAKKKGKKGIVSTKSAGKKTIASGKKTVKKAVTKAKKTAKKSR